MGQVYFHFLFSILVAESSGRKGANSLGGFVVIIVDYCVLLFLMQKVKVALTILVIQVT